MDPVLFVNHPAKELVCPGCVMVMIDPHLMSCCGLHVCQNCVEKFSIAEQSSPCCHESFGKYTTLLDKGVKQKIGKLKLKCAHYTDGCEWQGNNEDLVDHMNNECLHQIHPCPNKCGGLFPRVLLDSHKCNNDSTISKKPATRQQQTMEEDIMKSSPIDAKQLATVTDVNELNTKINSMQKDLTTDMKTNCQHLLHQLETTLFDAFKAFQEETRHAVDVQQKRMEDKLLEVEKNSTAKSMPASPIATDKELKWIGRSWPVPLSLAALSNTLLPLPPCIFTMEAFETYKKEKKEWFSPSFYSSPTGYKFVIGIQAFGLGAGKGTHVSLTVYLAKGEHDDQLKWPFRGRLKVSLLNWKDNCNNVDALVLFDDRAKVNGLSNRVVNEEQASKGCGFPRFVAHSDLHFNVLKNTEYLRNNILCFRVADIVNL